MADNNNNNSQTAAPIDLSAGLVTKTGTSAKPAPAPTIDLSAGMVEKPEPAAPPTLGDRAAHVRDATISWLTRPKATSDKVISDLGIPEFYALRTGVGSVASMVMHPWDTAKSMATQMAEAPTALAMAIIPEKWIDQARAQGYDLSRIDKARKDTAEQLKAMGHEIKTDPERFAGEQIVQALFFHALGEGAGMLKSGVTDAVKAGATKAGKAVFGVAPVDTAATVRDIAEDNAETAAENKKAEDAHQTNLAEIKTANEAKVQRTADLNAKRLATHLKKIDKVQADNADLEQAARDRTKQAQAKITDSHAAATQAAADAEDTESQRGQLARSEIQTRGRIMDRVQSNYKATRARIDAAFDDIRRTVNNVDAKDEAAQAMFGEKPVDGQPAPKLTYDKLTPEQRLAVDKEAPSKTAPVAPLVESVAQASEKFKGSAEKLKIFNDIVSRAKDEGGLNEIKEQIAKSFSKTAYKDLPPAHLRMVNEMAEAEHAAYLAKRGLEEPAEQQIDFDHLRGYSSELGRAIDDSYKADGPGDVRRALQDVKSRADAMAQALANDAGVGGKLKTAKQHWHIFKSVYEEPTGPSSSGSPVAQSVDAGQAFPRGNAFHATEPFLKDDPILANRARELAVGRKFTDPYYDPNLGKLIDRLRQIKAKQTKLLKPDKTAAAIAARPTEPPAVVEHQPAKLKDLPEPKDPLTPKLAEEPTFEPKPTTPETTDELHRRNIQTLRKKAAAYRNVSVYRAAEMIAGTLSVVSGIASLVTKEAGMATAATGLGLASGGAFLFALGPRMLANMLDSPKIIEQLAKPTIADYKQVMKLPPVERGEFAKALRDLGVAAEKAGKLKRPSPWLSFLSKVATGAAAANKPAREQQQQIDKTRSEQLDKDTLPEADKAINEADKALNESKVKVPIAIHDKTGHKLVHTGHGWVDMQTGEPVNG